MTQQRKIVMMQNITHWRIMNYEESGNAKENLENK
jgi:hypothetical protein